MGPTVLAALLCGACNAKQLEHGISEAEERFAEDIAAAYCEAALACDCDEGYATMSECASAERAAVADAQRRAQEAGLSFDPQCAGELIERYADIGCRSWGAAYEALRPPDRMLLAHCPAYHGDIPAEEPCDGVPLRTPWSACEQGTTCDAFEQDGRCEAFETEAPSEGEPCEAGNPSGAWSCQAPWTCVGTSSEPLIGVCGEPAAEGDNCNHRACAEGLTCALVEAEGAFFCKQPFALGATCEASYDCASAYCECADGSEDCESQVCIEARPEFPLLCERHHTMPSDLFLLD